MSDNVDEIHFHVDTKHFHFVSFWVSDKKGQDEREIIYLKPDKKYGFVIVIWSSIK